MTGIPFVDLAVDGDQLRDELAAVERVLRRGWFVLGPEVEAFEEELAAASGVSHAVGVASGTDALTLGMLALGIGPGDEVIVPDFTAFPTAVAVLRAGATPVLVDVESDRPLLDLDATVAAWGPATKAAILVHLYGVAADAEAFATAIAARRGVLIEDCAQAQGAVTPSGAPVGTVGAFGALSFYPTKNLGGVGDGGAVITADPALAEEIRVWRSHGERSQRYLHELPAGNSRLDDVQAAVLRTRVAGLEARVRHLRDLSATYAGSLGDLAYAAHGTHGAPHLAVVRVDNPDRAANHLAATGIQTGRHYPRPLSAQPALAACTRPTPAPSAATWARGCLSLPLHPGLTHEAVTRVSETLLRPDS